MELLFYAVIDFAIAALNVYFVMRGSGHTALNGAASVFGFGMGFVQVAMYLKKGR